MRIARPARRWTSLALRFGQHVLEARSLLAHLRQDEVRGPVDDAGDPLDSVGGQAFAQRRDDRHAAGNRRFEGDHYPFLLCGKENLVAVCSQQGLVGGYDMLAVVDRRQNQVLRDFSASDQFDHDIDVGMAHHFGRVIGDLGGVTDQFACPAEVLVGDHFDDDSAASPPGDFFLVAAKHGERPASDGADAEQAHVYRFH